MGVSITLQVRLQTFRESTPTSNQKHRSKEKGQGSDEEEIDMPMPQIRPLQMAPVGTRWVRGWRADSCEE